MEGKEEFRRLAVDSKTRQSVLCNKFHKEIGQWNGKVAAAPPQQERRAIHDIGLLLQHSSRAPCESYTSVSDIRLNRGDSTKSYNLDEHWGAVEDISDEDAFMRMLEALWHLLRKHQNAATQAICEGEDVIAANSRAMNHCNARLNARKERITATRSSIQTVKADISSTITSLLGLEGNVSAAIESLLYTQDDTSKNFGGREKEKVLTIPEQQNIAEYFKVSEKLKAKKAEEHELDLELQRLNNTLRELYKEKLQVSIQKRMEVVQEKYKEIVKREGELQLLQRWWKSYGVRQLIHEQRQSLLPLQRKPSQPLHDNLRFLLMGSEEGTPYPSIPAESDQL